jgi:hypothetical protein
MSDNITGIIPDDIIDEDGQVFGLSEDGLIEDDLGVVDDLDVLVDDVAAVGLEDEFLFDEDDSLGSVKKKRVLVEGEEGDEFADEIFDEDEDDDDDLITEEDDEARYNYRAEEDPLDEGY